MKALRKLLDECLPSRHERFLWLIVSLITLAIVAVNAMSIMTEAERRGDPLDVRVPWITEATSAFFVILLFPVVAWFVRRLPFDARGLRKAVVAHLALSVAFSAVHVAGMVLLRKIVFRWGFGFDYSFFDVIWRDALYEYRKDVVTYAMFCTLIYLVQALMKRDEALASAEADLNKRVALKSGSQTVLIDPEALLYAKAAGNYVEIFVREQTHLVRISMAKLERLLEENGADIARIHRSYLAAKPRIASIKPKNDGDAEITLSNGERLPVSRRYRKNLSS